MKIRTRFPTLGPGGSFVGFMLIAGAMTAPTPSTGEPAPPEASGGQSTDEPEDYSNWVEFSVGGVFTSGDRAKFQQRQQIPGGEVFGGVEDFHWEQFVGESGLFQMDGRAIFDNNDYLFKLSLEDPDKGFFRFGYREFRTWYDGSGGFFPQNRQWFELFDDEMAVDRGEFWAEVGLTLPDRPVVIFRYRHLFRDGRKNSTAWGDTQLTGGFGDRRIVPAFWELDEERDIFEVDVRHHLGKTDWGLAGRMELVDNDNARKMRRRPDEGSDRFLTHR